MLLKLSLYFIYSIFVLITKFCFNVEWDKVICLILIPVFILIGIGMNRLNKLQKQLDERN